MTLPYLFNWIRFPFAEILEAFFISSDTGKGTFRVSGDFRSLWKEEVDIERKHVSLAAGHPQVLESPPKTC